MMKTTLGVQIDNLTSKVQSMTRSQGVVRLILLSILLICLVWAMLTPGVTAVGQGNATWRPPFTLPFGSPPSASTWLFEQFFGNTVEAYNFGKYWYAAGQGLHFGLDFEARCGTPVLAIGDGIVDAVDHPTFGAAPHNLAIRHEREGVLSVYGHLQSKSVLAVGQPVRRGDIIGYVGDPDLTCVSRPHLHLEIRSLDRREAYNPVNWIDADWHGLYSLHQAEVGGFAKEIAAPNRWQRIDDQPDIQFTAAIRNKGDSWPPPARNQAPFETRPIRNAATIDVDQPLRVQRLTGAGCCTDPWWAPTSDAIYFLDAPLPDEEIAVVRRVDLSTGISKVIQLAPPSIDSLDGRYQVQVRDGATTLLELGTNKRRPLPTRGAYPRFSPASTRLLWHIRPADDIPGEIPPLTEIWIAEVATGDARLVRLQQGGGVRWLDEDRLLVFETALRTQQVQLSVLTLSTGLVEPLVSLPTMRSLSVAPGGKLLMYYVMLQPEPTANGVFLIETKAGATPRRLPFFGGWRWRDSQNVLYLPFGVRPMRLYSYNVLTGVDQPLGDVDPVLDIAAGEWDVSVDGNKLWYVSSTDGSIRWIQLPLRRF
jgi:hypothetical protein